VHFELTDEQLALQTTVRDYLADRFSLARVREVYDDPTGDADPPALWSGLAEQGWLAVCVPEAYDGIGLGLLDAAVIARCLGAGVVPGPWAPTVLGGGLIRLAGSPEQQAEHLPRLAAGDLRLALAVHREGGEWTAEGIGVRASPTGQLTGTASGVEYAARADRLVVAAADGHDVSFWLVDPRAEGVTVTEHRALDRTTRLTTVGFHHIHGERLPAGSAVTYADLLDRAAVLAAADLVGLAREALSRTVAYDQDRVQFGKPVGSFQAIKHALADLHVGVTMAEHGVLYAAYAIDVGLPDARLMAAVAKAKASDMARDVTAAMIQYHGGIGYTWEHDAHFYFKRAKRLEYAYGDAATHRERIARLTVDRAPVLA
jgi:alkylation response protein AidB-like acyl-CoA dehydrogenase